MVDIPQDQIWMVVVGFIIAFILAFGIGANDVANSFGTSVGSKVLTLRQACILASVFETLGSMLLGAKVSDTIRKGIIDVTPYQNDSSLLMAGNVAALSGSCCWLMAATLLRLPVSATHSIVGATVGFALVAHGHKGVKLSKLGMIIGSWFISPVLAGVVSTLLFYFCKFFILSKRDPLEPGLKFLPIFYAVTIAINMFSVFYDGPERFHFDKIPLWGTFIISIGSGLICAILVRTVVVPWQRKRIKKDCQKLENAKTDANADPEATADPPVDSLDDVKKHTMIEMQDQEKVPLPDHHHEHAATNIPFSAAGKAIAEITHEKKPVPATGKINKAEDAPLMENEYNSGSVTPKNLTTVKQLNDANSEKCGTAEKTALNGANTVICKTEDAPLMDNEYKFGRSSPRKPTKIGDYKGADKDMVIEVSALGKVAKPNGELTPVNGSQTDVDEEGSGRLTIKDRPEQARLFSFLQILTAVFGAFAHGGNDVSNAIGPLVSLWLTGTTGIITSKQLTPMWILFYGGVGISIGLWVWGRRVIKTVGEDLTKITPSSGFCIEIGSAVTVLVASNVGIPISTTHCKVGSVVFVGRFRARENVDWSIFRNIVLAWLVTLPITGGISAAIMAGLMLVV